ncbi:SIS domain-containing protein [Paenibacillus lycopersici]|uniref:SIS domain-containing protein n=1 Tax=Paenibacillus lycopersici TaxID=2704462 RepID=A0A6C0FXK9_9BACL|nr:SIS domain-containing protein [Paenibacillus lycopersici]QHT61437.1 SIS domain-containing protein [Paenibacillus lycopersici]
MSLTYEEIKAQYTALKQTFDYLLSQRSQIADFFRAHAGSSVAFVGCGSSYAISESGAFSMRLRAKRRAIALAGGDLMLNADGYVPLLADAVLIAPSRSGATSEIVEAIRLAKQRAPVPVLAVVCVPDSPVSAMADLTLTLPWAFDRSVCQTRTVANLYAANLMLAAFIGEDETVIDQLALVIAQGEAYMNRVEAQIREAGDFDWTNVVLLADGEVHGLAAEGAIALTEIAKAQAHAFHVLDVRHGPMVTVGPDTLVIAHLTSRQPEQQRKLLQDIRSRGAKVIAFGDASANLSPDDAELVIQTESELSLPVQGIPFLFIPQIVALGRAERMGINPDEPEGLTAWVKL